MARYMQTLHQDRVKTKEKLKYPQTPKNHSTTHHTMTTNLISIIVVISLQPEYPQLQNRIFTESS